MVNFDENTPVLDERDGQYGTLFLDGRIKSLIENRRRVLLAGGKRTVGVDCDTGCAGGCVPV
jgi:hypothetical protein